MTDQFELRLQGRIRAHTDVVSRPVDHAAIAAAATTRRRGRWHWLGGPWFVTSYRREVLLFVVLALALAAVAGVLLAAGSFIIERPLQPEPRILAIVRDDGLYYAAPDGTGERLMLAGAFQSVAWSSDGRRLAVSYSSSESEPRALILDESGDLLVRLDAFMNRWPGAWSPDGRWLFGADITGQRAPAPRANLLDTTGGPSMPVILPTDAGRRWEGFDSIAWRPDGQWALASIRRYANLCHEMVWIPADPAQSSVLFEDGETTLDCIPHQPAWSSDGRLLATLHSFGPDCWPYQATTRCHAQLVVREVAAANPPAPAGGPVVLLDEAEGILGSPVWLPGDRALVIARRSSDDALAEVVVVSVDGGATRVVASIATRDLLMRWATPGKSVLYRTGAPADYSIAYANPYSGELRMLDLESGADVLVASDVDAADMQKVIP